MRGAEHPGEHLVVDRVGAEPGAHVPALRHHPVQRVNVRLRQRVPAIRHCSSCLQPRRDQRGEQHRRRADQPGQPNRPGHVGRGRRLAVTQQAALLHPALVAVRAAEPDAERTGERRLAPARVRAGMLVAVPAQRAQGGRARPPTAGRQRRGQQPGDPGRDQVGRVVQPRRGPAEPLVARAAVADHRVQRVHRAVAEQAGQAERGPPQQRRDHRVRGVLGHRLDRRPGQPGGVERPGVAPAQRGQHLPGRGQVAGLQGPAEGQCLPAQAGAAEHGPAGQRGGGGAGDGMATGQPPGGQPGHGHRQQARGQVSRAAAAAVRPQPGLGPPGQGAERRDRVPAARVGQRGVQRGPQQQPGGPPGARWDHPPSLLFCPAGGG